MDAKVQKKVEAEFDDTKDDFFGNYNGMMFVLGYLDRGVKSLLMRILIIMVITSMLVMTLLTVFLVNDNEMRVFSVHTIALTLYVLWMVGHRLWLHDSLMEARAMILRDVYLYEGEAVTEEMLEIKRLAMRQMRMRVKYIGLSIAMSSVSLLLLSLAQVFFVDVDEDHSVLNPLLPAPFYLPFETFSPIGFAGGLVVNLANIFIIYGTGFVVFVIYYSLGGQLTLQIRLLNHSLLNIHNRALHMYLRLYPEAHLSKHHLYYLKEFQDCVYRCLRANALHHQAIMRFHALMKTFCGHALLFSVALAPALLAGDIYLIITNPTGTVFKQAMYIFQFICEVPYNFFLCAVGEELLLEFCRYQESLYDVPWYNYGRKFNMLLIIMMRYSTKPLEIKADLINVTASMETFNELMTVMFKITNIWRQNEVR